MGRGSERERERDTWRDGESEGDRQAGRQADRHTNRQQRTHVQFQKKSDRSGPNSRCLSPEILRGEPSTSTAPSALILTRWLRKVLRCPGMLQCRNSKQGFSVRSWNPSLGSVCTLVSYSQELSMRWGFTGRRCGLRFWVWDVALRTVLRFWVAARARGFAKLGFLGGNTASCRKNSKKYTWKTSALPTGRRLKFHAAPRILPE